MEQNVKISGTQVAMLLFIFVTSTLVLYVPKGLGITYIIFLFVMDILVIRDIRTL